MPEEVTGSVHDKRYFAKPIGRCKNRYDRGTLRGLRDRAMLLIGYAGGLRRSESVGLDVKADQTEDGRG